MLQDSEVVRWNPDDDGDLEHHAVADGDDEVSPE